MESKGPRFFFVFPQGGDQSILRGALRGTRMADALQRLLARHGAVGGASAGASLLWSLDFKGIFGQTTSER